MTGISKTFPGVRALARRRLPAVPGRGPRPDGRERRRQVHPDQGADRRLRHRCGRRSPSTASRSRSAARCRPQQAGVSTVYQEVNLCPNLSVAENIFIGREPRRLGADPLGRDAPAGARPAGPARPRPRRHRAARHVLARGAADGRHRPGASTCEAAGADPGRADLQPRRRRGARSCSGSCASSRTRASRSCSSRTSSTRSTRSATASRCCATARWSASTAPSELPQFELVEKMIGQGAGRAGAARRAAEARHRRRRRRGPAAWTPTGSAGAARSRRSSLRIHAGEVVGLAGLLGSGRTEVARLLFGADRADHGQVRLDGGRAPVRNPIAGHRRRVSASARRTARPRASSPS